MLVVFLISVFLISSCEQQLYSIPCDENDPGYPFCKDLPAIPVDDRMGGLGSAAIPSKCQILSGQCYDEQQGNYVY